MSAARFHPRRLWRALWLAGPLALCGCASIAEQSHAYLGSARYPPTNPAAVQILPAEPRQTKERLGEIVLSVEGNPTRERLENRLKKAGARLGADAVFVAYDQTHFIPIAYYNWWGPPWLDEDINRDIVAVAIKFK